MSTVKAVLAAVGAVVGLLVLLALSPLIIATCVVAALSMPRHRTGGPR